MRKKIASFFLVFMMGCSIFSVPADAATEVYVKSAVNVRSEASNSSEILGVVTKGSKLKKLSEARGWSKVSYKGQEAYVASSFLTEIKSGTVDTTTAVSDNQETSTTRQVQDNQNPSRAKVYVKHSFVNIREQASSSSALLGTAKKGATFYRVESKNGWTKIEYGAGYAYIASQYLTASQSDLGNKNNTVYVNYKRVNIRKAASSKSTLLGYATKGQKFTSYGTSGTYTKVKFNGQYGYIATQYLSAEQAAVQTPTVINKTAVYVNNRYVNIRSKASSKSNLLGKAYKGEKLYKLGVEGSYTKIQYGNSVGYVATMYLTNKPVAVVNDGGTTSTAYVKNQYVNVRKTASSKSTLLGKLYKGAKVTVVGKQGSFTKIKYNNSYAYVATQYLSA